jgi:hypothetical protein
MPLQTLQFRPGVNREGTTLANEGGWFDGDKIRFRSGYPEKIGGWALLSTDTFLGVCRSMWGWITLKGYNLLGVGTNLKFYIEDQGAQYHDITPIKETNTNLTGTITLSITNNSTVLTITDNNADSLQVGDFITLSGAVALGAVGTNVTAAVLNQEYQIASLTSGTVYSVNLRAAGTSVAGVPFIVNTSTNYVSFPTGTILTNGDKVTLVSSVQPPTGLSYTTIYYLINVVGTTCQLSLTSGGSPVSITSLGIGQQAVTFLLTSNRTDSSSAMTLLEIAYQINTGFPIYTIGTGWGAGPWNAGTVTDPWAHGWGTGYSTGFGLQLRLWSQSNFGENLLFSPRGGALYVWLPGGGATPAYGVRGQVVSGPDIPSKINQIMVSDTTRIVIAFGCNSYGAYGTGDLDPLLIRWTEQESYTQWSLTATGQAGDYRLSHGSEIIGALQTRQEIVIFTDSAIYSMQYLGPPLVWGFTLLADNISIVSPNAVATAAGVVYWMGTDKFYVYSGRVETLPCAVRQYVFSDINRDQEAQFFAGSNEGYSEIWWFYCSANSNTIDRYVIFNYLDRVWYYGTMDRTAWLDSPIRQFPQAASVNNYIVLHESDVNDNYVELNVNNQRPISSYIQSSDFDIGDGHNYGFVWRMLPDITFDASTTPAPNLPSATFTMRPRQNPGSNYSYSQIDTVTAKDSYAIQHTYTVQQFTEIIYTRVRGRQMALRVSSDSLGTQWQLGVPRMDIRPDGRR